MKKLRRFRTFGGLIIVFLASFLLLSESAMAFFHWKHKKEDKERSSLLLPERRIIQTPDSLVDESVTPDKADEEDQDPALKDIQELESRFPLKIPELEEGTRREDNSGK